MFTENEIELIVQYCDSLVFPVQVTDKLIRQACDELSIDCKNNYFTSAELKDIQTLINKELPF